MISKDSIDCVTFKAKKKFVFLNLIRKLQVTLSESLNEKVYFEKYTVDSDFGNSKYAILFIKKRFKKEIIVEIDLDDFEILKEIVINYKYYPILKSTLQLSKINLRVKIVRQIKLHKYNFLYFLIIFIIIMLFWILFFVKFGINT